MPGSQRPDVSGLAKRRSMIRVLLVDNRNAGDDSLRALLADQGCDITEARDIPTALAAARDDPPDIVVACVEGIEQDALLFRWHSDPRLQSIPVVIYGERYSLAAAPEPGLLAASAVIDPTADVQSTLTCLQRVLDESSREHAESPPSRLTAEDDAELRANESRLRLATEAANIGLWDWELQSDTLYLSPIYKRQIGYEDHELANRFEEWHSRVHPDDVERTLKAFADCIASPRATLETEFRFRHKDGSYRWILSKSSKITDAEGRLLRILGAHLDITERKQIEAALRDSESKFLGAFRDNPAALTLIGPNGEYVEVNQAFCDLTGYRLEEVLGKSVVEMGTLAESDQHTLYFDAASAEREILATEFQYRTRDGRVRYVIASSTPIMVNGVRHRINTGVDITERKLAEERVRRLNRTYAMLSDINQLIVREHEPQVVLECACQIAVAKGGFALAWIGSPEIEAGKILVRASAATGSSHEPKQINLLQDWRFERELSDRVLATGQHEVLNDIEGEVTADSLRTAALERGYQSIASFPLIVHQQPFGTFSLYAGQKGFFDAEELQLLDELARDISFAIEVCGRERERQTALQRLQESEERFRELAETIEDLFWVADGQMRRFYYLSPAFESIWQRSCRSLYDNPQSWLETIHPDDRARVSRDVQLGAEDKRREGEYRIVRPDGAIRWVKAQMFAVRNTAGTIDRIVGVARDVTDSRILQQQLAHSQKMQAIGTLAGGIAHDFNNLLAAILGNAELARLDSPESSGMRDSVDEIIRAGQRARELVQRILTFSRPQEHQLKPVQLQSVVEEAARLLRSTLPAGVRIQVQSAPALPAVRADESQIHQVIVNIVTNAWHAMRSQSGRVDISLQVADIDVAFCQSHSELSPGPHLRLSISDTGQGMDEETLARIFDPFFTTKPSGQGAGLGLSIVHGIVRAHGGAIVVETHLGRGTTFHVYLPVSGQAADPVVDRMSAAHGGPGNGERILYLDDEESLVYLAVRYLSRLGYQVNGYTRAEEALAAFRANPGAFDLVITDFNMPGMSGMEVTRRLLEIDREASVVLASGYVRPAEIEEATALGVQEVFLKPNDIDEFGAVVQRLLSQRHRRH
ncbi:MAG: PAS domain S-box protein [Steroidobacteraceae bacterium]